MRLNMKRTLAGTLVLLAVLARAVPVAAQAAGAAGAEATGEAGAEAAGAPSDSGGGAHSGGSGGAGGSGPVGIGGKTSYDLLEGDNGQACAIGHGRGSAGFGLLLGALGAIAVRRRWRF
jgi:hypothetical protein